MQDEVVLVLQIQGALGSGFVDSGCRNSGFIQLINSPPTFASARSCKPFTCTGGNSVAVADKSDDFSPSIINSSTPELFPPSGNQLATASRRGIY
jgi:hypothetical protein